MFSQIQLGVLVALIALAITSVLFVFTLKRSRPSSNTSSQGQSRHHETIKVIRSIEADAALLKTLAIMVMMFLPGSFIAALFATELFSWDSLVKMDEGNVDPSMWSQFKVHWIIGLALPVAIIGLLEIYYRFPLHSRPSRRREIPPITDRTERELFSQIESNTTINKLAVIAMIFLPLTFSTSLFSMNFFDFEISKSLENGLMPLNLSPESKRYLVITLPIIFTGLVAGIHYCFRSRYSRRRREKSVITDSTMQELLARVESDAASMKIVTALAIVFLPASFISTLFSMDLFDLEISKSPENGNITLNPFPEFTVYWAVAMSLSAISLGLYHIWTTRNLWKPPAAKANPRVESSINVGDNASVTKLAAMTILFIPITFLSSLMSAGFCGYENLMCLDKLNAIPSVLTRLHLYWIAPAGLIVSTVALAYYFRKQLKTRVATIPTRVRYHYTTYRSKVRKLTNSCTEPAFVLAITIFFGASSIFLALMSTLLGVAQLLLTFRQARVVYPKNPELLGEYPTSRELPGNIFIINLDIQLLMTIPTIILTFLISIICIIWILLQDRPKNDTRIRPGILEPVPETLSTEGLVSATVILMPRGSISVMLLIRIFLDGLKSTVHEGNTLGAGVGSKLSLTLIPITLGSHRLYYWWNESNEKRYKASTLGQIRPTGASELILSTDVLNSSIPPGVEKQYFRSRDPRRPLYKSVQDTQSQEGLPHVNPACDDINILPDINYSLSSIPKISSWFRNLLQPAKTIVEFDTHRFITNNDHFAPMNSKELYHQINRHLDGIPFAGFKVLNVVHAEGNHTTLENPENKQAKALVTPHLQSTSFTAWLSRTLYMRIQALDRNKAETDATTARTEILRLRLTLRLLIGLSTLDLGLCISTKQTELAGISTTLLFMCSSIIGYAFLSWRFSKFHDKDVMRKRDIVVLTRNGGFAVIKCSKDVASELEEKEYRTTRLMINMLISISSTIPTPSLTLLNTFIKKKGITPAASLINLIFVNFSWCLDLIKGLSRQPRNYTCEVVPSEALTTSSMSREEGSLRCDNPGFISSLWCAIRETKRIDWVQTPGVVPNTPHWNKWLSEAEANAENETCNWDAVRRKHEIDNMDLLVDQDETSNTPVVKVQPHSVRRLPSLFGSAFSTLNSLCENLKETLWWKYMFRPPVPADHERLEWICECGRPLFGDFRNPSLEFKDQLATTRSKRKMQATTAGQSSSTGTMGQSGRLAAPNRVHMRQSATRQVGWSNPPSNSPTSPSTSRKTSATVTQSVVPPQMCVLVCLKFSKRRTKAEAVWYHHLTTDGDVFTDIRKKYHEVRPSRLPMSLRLKHPAKAVFIKFLFEKAPVMSRIAGTEERPSIPPKEFVDNGKYHYTPCPLEEQPMPSDTFLHFLTTQDTHDQRLWGPRLPKKIHDKDNTMPSFTANWGVQIEEGPNWAFISFLMFVALLLSGLVAGIYGWKTGDKQTAVAIGTWMTTVQGLGLSTLYFFYA